MSAPDLLVVIDPAARQADGESVRITRDVLCAGAPGTKVCLPKDREEAARALSRRGGRRPVVVGDDRALLRTVRQLHQERGLGDAALSVVPVGTPANTTLLRALGVPAGPVAASRAVLNGPEQARDLLVDDSGGVVLGALHVPAWPSPYDKPGRAESGGPGGSRGGGRGAAVTGGTARDGPAEGKPEEGEPARDGPARAPAPDARAPDCRPGESVGGAAHAPASDGDADAVDGTTAAALGEQSPGGTGRPREGPPEGATGGSTGPTGPPGPPGPTGPMRRGARSLLRTLTHPVPLLTGLTKPSGPAAWWGRTPEWDQRLRVEADGAVLADLDRPVTQVSLAPGYGGFAEVVVRERAGEPVRARARTVTVCGADFHYRADALMSGPVRSRTWTALEAAWRLTLPTAPEEG
ncbi:hypothetical protein [Streptomyces oceani]|uniref:DAGKc domain-containing protein n=1 Tax=Streptomyces oceani TaxID=1075402 RepID=A0A1E7JXD0_9ACTN|nr:hypothetical protein [Streptomyces oceani]OEU96331.1 hypothetical protein AN216_20925 [Streptomyces oceani]